MNKLLKYLELSMHSLGVLNSHKPSIDGCETKHSSLTVSSLVLVTSSHRQIKSAGLKAINILERYKTKSLNSPYGLRCTYPKWVIGYFNNHRGGVSHARISVTRYLF